VTTKNIVKNFLQELTAMRAFLTIWSGQFVSLIGSGITSFALDLWVYQQTGSVTQYALIALFNVIPPILMAPIAGVFVDRWDRRSTILGSDLIAAIVTGFIAVLFFAGNLQVWQVAIITTIISTVSVFQRLALTTSTKLLVADKNLENAVGLTQIGESIGSLVIPALSGTLVLLVKMEGVLLIDFTTYLFSLFTLLLVKIPTHVTTDPAEVDEKPQGWAAWAALRSELQFGWQYTLAHPDILSLLIYFTVINFLIGLVSLLLVPMILGFLSSSVAGSMLTIGGIGSLFGGLLLGFFGGSKYRITKIMFFGVCLGLCIILAGLQPSSILITIAIFVGMLSFSLINGISEVLFISNVPVEVQGRVFGLQGMIAASSLPIAYLMAGPLTDWIFEPLLAKNGALADTVGQIVGVGSGRGIALLFIVLGILQVAVTLYAYSYRPLRKLDSFTPPLSSENSELENE
jgi:MFS transporter, DHA3 family, macrolide efflux protein